MRNKIKEAEKELGMKLSAVQKAQLKVMTKQSFVDMIVAKRRQFQEEVLGYD